MTDVAYATAVVLAAVFAWAGAAKLADRARTASTLRAFGLPAASALAVAVPSTELVLAAGLLVVPAVAAYAALGLIAAFTTFLVRAVRAGVDVGCGCFGSARSEPVSTVEVLRNVMLAGAAVIASFSTGPVAPGLDAVILVSTAAALAAVALALADVRRRTGRVFGLGVGDSVPDGGLGPGSGAR